MGLVKTARLAKRIVAVIRSFVAGKPGRPLCVLNRFSILKLDDHRNRFVGYYDHSPFRPGDECLLLVHSTSYKAYRQPSPDFPVSIELVNHMDGTLIRELGQSYAWNWQQGARALWLDSETLIFNIYDSLSDRYKARIVDTGGLHLQDIPIPVQEVDSKGRIYGLSYEALAAIRPDYGYRNRLATPETLSDNAIEQFDPHTQRLHILVRQSLLQKMTEARLGRAITRAKFNHVMASPDAMHIVFLFRYFLNGRRMTDLYEVNTDSRAIRLLVSDKGVSHCCWWGADAVVATMLGDEGFGYYLVPIDGREPTLLWAHTDGHPSRLDEHHLLTDTYPDRYRNRSLLIHSLETGALNELGVFPEPLLFQGETRCDLHPSLSPSGRYIQVDCAIGHRRTVAIMQNPYFNS